MPAEVKNLKIKSVKNGKNSGIVGSKPSTKHKEQLNDLKSLLGSIVKMKDSLPDKEMFSVVIKKFIYTVTTVPDNYFLSDACELTHEMFLEFRIILGYYEKGVGKEKKLLSALEDIGAIAKELYGMYREFLDDDAGYNGTSFPKPKKIKAMRQLAEIVKDAGDVVILNKNKTKKLNGKSEKVEEHIAIDIPNEEKEEEPTSEALKELINSFSRNYFKSDDSDDIKVDYDTNRKITQNPIITSIPVNSPSDSVSTGSFNPDTNLLKSYDTPLTPRLYSEEVSTIKATKLKMGNKGESVLVAAMGELMAAPPPPPSTRHGRIVYVEEGAANSGNGRVPTVPSRRAQALRPPILVDDDGDILPANGPSALTPPPKSAAASIYESSGGRIIVDDYCESMLQLETPKGFTPRGSQAGKVLEDDDSFIVAYREFVMNSGEERRTGQEANTKRNSLEMESSGWSLKNRI